MSFGSLLGSLYGDLPAPKSGPAPPSDSASLIKTKPCIDPVGVSSTPNRPETVVPVSTVVDIPVSTVKTISAETAKSILLMAPPPRKRDCGTRRVRPLPPVSKRPKDAIIQSVKGPSKIEVEAEAIEPTALPATDASRALPQKVVNEYDAAKPNSYDDFIKERARVHRKREEDRRQQEEMERLREEQRRALSSIASSGVANRSEACLAISGDEAWRRRSQLSAAYFGENERPADSGVTTCDGSEEAVSTDTLGEKKNRGFAQKLLEKMGWKHGEGLGKEKQGILAPLVARKTDKRSGVIVQGNKPPVKVKPKYNQSGNGVTKSSYQQTQNDEIKSRIVILTNLVGKGEVDAELETETAEEAAKYGNLLTVKIIEIAALADDKAVRIFCEYDSVDGATKAISSFNGRLFGGRSVKAEYYNEELFSDGCLS